MSQRYSGHIREFSQSIPLSERLGLGLGLGLGLRFDLRKTFIRYVNTN